MKIHQLGAQNERRGSALVTAVIACVVLSGLAGTLLAVSGSYKNEHVSATENHKVRYIAEAGLSEGLAFVRATPPAINTQTTFGTVVAPMDFSGGAYWCTVTRPADEDDPINITAFAVRNGQSRGVEALMTRVDDGIFASALFAGNTSGDPNYIMNFGGVGIQADAITGNIYSGGNVEIEGDADVNGEIKASGTITGGTGTEGKTLPVPDIAGMNYETSHDYNVAAMFSTATYKSSSSLGGTAWQMPATSPAHIFRKNPNDRTADTSKTKKDDFFLEDPYEKVNTSSKVDPSNATAITLGAGATNKVYYIDGNLWIHNKNIFSFVLGNSGSGAVSMTIVVKGNIYISDNIMYKDADLDGLAMIAIKDSKETDSGNIYFGDPTFGTLERMDSFMYAENDFIDNNLSATGSATVTVNGNMTAGNQVRINRDFGNQHSKLTVNFDDRLINDEIRLPGLPSASGAGDAWALASWREISAP